jgi:DNA-binding NarL/FixJ family response regulator
MSAAAVRVVIVDDQAMVRQGLRLLLEAEDGITVVGEAADGAEAIDVTRRSGPDVVLLDVRMPRMDGIEACERISAIPDAPYVLMLTTFDLEDHVRAALRAGASGFLLKDAPAEDLVAAVQVVARGDAVLAPSVTRTLIDQVARAGPPPAPHPGVAQLTEREHEVLVLMARGRTNAEIAEELYLGEATVKTHVGRVLAKLRARDRVGAVVIAFESGVVRAG